MSFWANTIIVWALMGKAQTIVLWMSVNRQTCFADLPKVITPVSCYLCMCVYMNVCVSCCINVCCLVSKIMKEITYIEWNISSRKAQHPFVPGLHFQGQSFGILFVLRISCGWWKMEKILLWPSHRKSYFFPSNCTIVNVAHRDLDLYFQGDNISGNI